MKNKLSTIIGLACSGLLVTSQTFSNSMEFDFKDPKKVNSITFLLDAPLESINGTGNGIKGKVSYDPANPSKLAGKIKLKTKSLTVPNSTMENHLHGEKWMNVDQFEHITFEAKSLSNISTSENTTKGDLFGHISIKGITKEITVPITITHLPGKLAERSNGAMEGDLLVLRSNFFVNRNEFNINPGQALDKVAENIEIRLAIAGAAQTDTKTAMQ